MYISRAEVHNYKSFYNSGPVDLKPGFNVVVGPNNAGKTALLEALSLSFAADPHRTERTIPYPGRPLDSLSSSVDVSIGLNREELREILEREGMSFNVARPEVGGAFGDYDGSPSSGRVFMQRIMERDNLTFAMRFTVGPGRTESWEVATVPSFGLYGAVPAQQGRWSLLGIKYENGVFVGQGLTQGAPPMALASSSHKKCSNGFIDSAPNALTWRKGPSAIKACSSQTPAISPK